MGIPSPDIGELEYLKWADVGLAIEAGLANRTTSRGSRRGSAARYWARTATWRCWGRAIEAAEGFGGFVMIHVGNNPTALPELMDMLRPGDVVTHAFHGFEDGVLEDTGAVVREMKKTQDRGVVIDVGHGAGSFSFKAAQKALANGVWPDTISTDISTLSIEGPVYDFATTLTKFMRLGMSLDEVVRRSTENPARALGLDGVLGTLRGAPRRRDYSARGRGRFPLNDRTSAMTRMGQHGGSRERRWRRNGGCARPHRQGRRWSIGPGRGKHVPFVHSTARAVVRYRPSTIIILVFMLLKRMSSSSL